MKKTLLTLISAQILIFSVSSHAHEWYYPYDKSRVVTWCSSKVDKITGKPSCISYIADIGGIDSCSE